MNKETYLLFFFANAGSESGTSGIFISPLSPELDEPAAELLENPDIIKTTGIRDKAIKVINITRSTSTKTKSFKYPKILV